jgi:hypothetical protein
MITFNGRGKSLIVLNRMVTHVQWAFVGKVLGVCCYRYMPSGKGGIKQRYSKPSGSRDCTLLLR